LELSFVDQLRSAGLSIPDLIALSEGILTEGKLKKHSNGTRLLSKADAALANEIIAAHRMAVGHARVVVFEAVTAFRAGQPMPRAALAVPATAGK